MARQEKRHRIPPKLNDRSRSLRRDATYPERLLRSVLRNTQLAGFRFRRQHPIGPYVVDFYCPGARLVVEVDGETHVGRLAADTRRTAYLRKQGLRVMRVTNDDVLEEFEAVATSILRAAESSHSAREPDPPPRSLPEREGE